MFEWLLLWCVNYKKDIWDKYLEESLCTWSSSYRKIATTSVALPQTKWNAENVIASIMWLGHFLMILQPATGAKCATLFAGLSNLGDSFWLEVLVEMVKLVRSYSSSCHRNWKGCNLQEHQDFFLGKPHTSMDHSGIREKTPPTYQLSHQFSPTSGRLSRSASGQKHFQCTPVANQTNFQIEAEESSKQKISGKCINFNGQFAKITLMCKFQTVLWNTSKQEMWRYCNRYDLTLPRHKYPWHL